MKKIGDYLETSYRTATLTELGVEPVGECMNKIISICCTACCIDFIIGCFRIAPL